MGCLIILKAILTRMIFGCHGFLAIWQVVVTTEEPRYWYLTVSLLVLMLEALFTLVIRQNQDWKWFCPSVFFYLTSVVPAIWLLELDKFYKRMSTRHINTTNTTSRQAALDMIATFPDAQQTSTLPGAHQSILNLTASLAELGLGLPGGVTEATWVAVLEQFLMLALILGRWLLPLGDLTREQLSQLLLVYIGTAADIIEFFDSFKDEKIADKEVLVLLVLAIWSWSLLQFTVIITSPQYMQRSITVQKRQENGPHDPAVSCADSRSGDVDQCCCVCCSDDRNDSCCSCITGQKSSPCGSCRAPCEDCDLTVFGVLLDIILQDAPFLVFRLLLILHYRLVSYMNIFFTAKNTLVICLQFYRLVVVQVRSKTWMSVPQHKAQPTNRGKDRLWSPSCTACPSASSTVSCGSVLATAPKAKGCLHLQTAVDVLSADAVKSNKLPRGRCVVTGVVYAVYKYEESSTDTTSHLQATTSCLVS
ncbi:transmembrane protein 26-like [Panulirus ornatus]|uniref:transmembrane protein 26-like n=1 Tax=Panulirus ornatus TaxID=150431 RepID=UPI003A89ED9E